MDHQHPYLSGNFAPVQSSLPLTACPAEGKIPSDLAGGQYIRNGANPVTPNEHLDRDTHWLDGDGMLSGVYFRRAGDKGTEIEPQFVNRYLQTDVYRYARHSRFLTRPVLPSLTTTLLLGGGPVVRLVRVLRAVLRTLILAVVSRLPGRPSIRKMSVANTSVVYHDGRALATGGAGPPLRFLLPGLETVGWFNGRRAQNEPRGDGRSGFRGDGPLAVLRGWTTTHPRVDPVTRELIVLRSTACKPYVRYSIVKPSKQTEPGSSIFDEPVPGVTTPKMVHDFGVSSHHTVIMDLPLELNPKNLLKGTAAVRYDLTSRSRFGVFPRYAPYGIRWFETSPCVIFRTANCWDTISSATKERPAETLVNMLVCRRTSATAVYNTGNITAPWRGPVPPEYAEEEQCRLYYYSFPITDASHTERHIRHQWALSAIPFDFPIIPADKSMSECRYVYGCSSSHSSTPAPGSAAKMDYLVKMDAKSLVACGIADPPPAVTGCVDTRTLEQVWAESSNGDDDDDDDPIKLFRMPRGWYAQEPMFVARADTESEDDGWLLTYVFDESTGLDEEWECREGAKGELWIIDARNMRDVAARVKLPQRVPYGLHGSWFSEGEILAQRPHGSVRDAGAVVSKRTVWKWEGILGGLGSVVERLVG
ncbi:Carotenoid 9,10(9',10')-cleavage dioxygenase-like protein [Hapsidospora chrysogenum ATCC 11550]|uniref:Carotenoid 9,10(9',10')-cleavage dioxygenase-like protein n=1 Tax=Hapsidospora chrysogenum (strain ATCC 11550 / CBS 779.69 / DSM 880 / IAM 14645 / JCM 23072 / IMI 49137) TaxID=857340 RepID=A0A086TDQ8_HAPC1|nr:Carotenoid 9,10(9',10')-cleavage dioxygenase-like protein [Hapsidospora chrysogenum ATCC 11550]